MPRFVPTRALLALLTTILATSAFTFPSTAAPSTATPATGAPATAAPAAAAGCDAGAVGFTPVLQLNLPTSANWLNKTPPYTLNNTAAIGSNFDRVGYCLELNGPKGVQWVWTAMAPFTTDARRLGLQTFAGQLVRQQVSDLEVSPTWPA